MIQNYWSIVMSKTKRFIHISDLHLGYSAWGTDSNDDRNRLREWSDRLKAECIDELVRYINSKSKGFFKAVLITGDIFEVQKESSSKGEDCAVEKGRALLKSLFEKCAEKDTQIIGISGEHDFIKSYKNGKVPYKWDDDFLKEYPHVHFYHQSGQASINGLKIGWIPGRPLQNHAEVNVEDWETDLDIVMVHDIEGKSSLLTSKNHAISTKYIAHGHIHAMKIEKVSDKWITGRPGHLYSLWDGGGKAWPTGFLEVEIDKHIKVHLFKARYRTLKLEATSKGYNVYGLKYGGDVKLKWDTPNHEIKEESESIEFKEGESREALLQRIAELYPDCVFVFQYKKTPGNLQKTVMTGKEIGHMLRKREALLFIS